MADLLDREFFRAQYDSVMEEKVTIAKALGIYAEIDLPAIRERYECFAERIRPLVRDTAWLLNQPSTMGRAFCSKARKAPCSISTMAPTRS